MVIFYFQKNLNLLVQNENNIALAIDLDWSHIGNKDLKSS